MSDAFELRQRFQLAIVRVPLARARAGMVRHQQFDQGPSRLPDLVRIGGHHQLLIVVVIHRTHARGREHTLSDIDHADAAHAHLCFVLLMAQPRNLYPLQARRVEHRGPFGDGYRDAVDCELDVAHDSLSSRIGQTPSGHRLRTMWASISSRKCSNTELSGEWAN